MIIYPETFSEDIEFDQILTLTANLVQGGRAKEHIKATQPYQNYDLWVQELNYVEEMKSIMLNGFQLNIGEYAELEDYFSRLEIENYSLSVEEVLEIRQFLMVISSLRDWGKNSTVKSTSVFKDNVAHIPPPLFPLLDQLNKIFEPDGSIHRKASPTLEKLYQQLDKMEKTIHSVFQQVLGKYKGGDLLSEPFESYKNGRRVLCVAIENKRRVRGIIQDESASGKTVYIEPEEMISLYQDSFNLRSDIRQEVNKIIRQICASIRSLLFYLKEGYNILTFVDIWCGKAELALKMQASLPQLKSSPFIQWFQAYHPLLLLKNNAVNKKTIPFELNMQPPNKMVLLSGPNAGGKSILLKAVALNQMMIQCGFLIPVDPRSTCGIFSRMFADIGDQQSLEEDLSTYSSHLKNMKNFVDLSDSKSLVFIDEMGSGTDPQYGGAISEAVLNKLNKKRVWGIVTTHYFNLKMYADQQKGIINAAMSFDKKHLEPTYRFVLGQPGSSFAFEIAKKTGLDNGIIEYAKKKSGKNKWAIEEMLVNLENEKTVLAKKEKELAEEKKKIDKLLKSNQSLANELTYQKKKWKIDRKKEVYNETELARKALKQKLKELQSKDNIEIAKAMEADIKEEQGQLKEEIKDLSASVVKHEKIPKDFFKNIKVGDFVKLKDGETSGEVMSIQKNKVVLQSGIIRLTVAKADLRPGREPLNIKRTTSVALKLNQSKESMETKIDIRGYSVAEAQKELFQFMDDALVSNAHELRILHGKGSGVLKRLVRDILQEFKAIKEISHPEPNKGGDGVTIVKF
ncbi:endonuclease MutS2 [Membranihabitans marinus]|uniref:endonuclease MutS2 n=1 Tax=Membranihabitans marinus TaxID=1227546 RepID=UPI001F21F7EC|nr:Smr/MutS family protein [Membranihabitans marinus]